MKLSLWNKNLPLFIVLNLYNKEVKNWQNMFVSDSKSLYCVSKNTLKELLEWLDDFCSKMSIKSK